VRKLIQGIIEFRRKVRPDYRETFARLALGQSPDALLVACSDSRVVPSLFASADPGDLFVIRNVGNLVPPCGSDGLCMTDESGAAAIEFSLLNLEVSDIIICGHSECGAMRALLSGRENVKSPHLREWLRHGQSMLKEFPKGIRIDPVLEKHNELSQLNVLQQMGHLRTYPSVQERLQTGRLRIHGWWFDIAKADVYAFEDSVHQFVLIDDEEATRILERLGD